MAYQPKYQYTYTEKGSGITRRVRFLVEGYVGGVTTLIPQGEGHSVATWEPDNAFGVGDEFDCVLRMASGTFRFHDAGGVILADLLGQADPVLVDWDEDLGPGYTDYLDLIVSPRNATRSAERFGGVSTIEATDDLDKLFAEDAYFASFGSTSGSEEIVRLLQRLLEASTLQLPLYTASNWYPSKGSSPGVEQLTATDDPLDHIEYQRDAWFNSTILAGEVIRHMLGPFGIEVYQFRGAWRAIQRENKEGGQYSRWQYPADYYQTATGATHASHNALVTLPSDIWKSKADGNGTFETLPAIVSAVAGYEHLAIDAASTVENPSFEKQQGDTDTASGWTKNQPFDTSLVKGTSTDGQWSQQIDAVSRTVQQEGAEAAFVDSGGRYLFQSIPVVAGTVFRLGLDFASDNRNQECWAYVEVNMPDGTSLTSDGTYGVGQHLLYHRVTGLFSALSILANEVTTSGNALVKIHRPVTINRGAVGGILIDRFVYEVVDAEEEPVEGRTLTSSISGQGDTRHGPTFFNGSGPLSLNKRSLLISGIVADNFERGPVGGSPSGVDLLELYNRSIIEGRENRPQRFNGTLQANELHSIPPIEVGDVVRIGSDNFAIHRITRSTDQGTADVEMYELNRSESSVAHQIGAISANTFVSGTASGGVQVAIGDDPLVVRLMGPSLITRLSSALTKDAEVTSVPIEAIGSAVFGKGSKVTITHKDTLEDITVTISDPQEASDTALTTEAFTPDVTFPAGSYVFIGMLGLGTRFFLLQEGIRQSVSSRTAGTLDETFTAQAKTQLQVSFWPFDLPSGTTLYLNDQAFFLALDTQAGDTLIVIDDGQGGSVTLTGTAGDAILSDIASQSDYVQTANQVGLNTQAISNQGNAISGIDFQVGQNTAGFNAHAAVISNNGLSGSGASITARVTANEASLEDKVEVDGVVAAINLSVDKIDGANVQITGETTFESGYDPSQKLGEGNAAADINANTTKINGGKVEVAGGKTTIDNNGICVRSGSSATDEAINICDLSGVRQGGIYFAAGVIAFASITGVPMQLGGQNSDVTISVASGTSHYFKINGLPATNPGGSGRVFYKTYSSLSSGDKVLCLS